MHVGHPEGYTAQISLAVTNVQRLHVLHPMGWDAFGLPAEQYAMDTGMTRQNLQQKTLPTSNAKSMRLDSLTTGIVSQHNRSKLLQMDSVDLH